MSKIEDNVIAKITHRAKKGKSVYGVTMEREDLTELEWLQHLQEEMLDGSIYIEKLIQIKECYGEALHSVQNRKQSE